MLGFVLLSTCFIAQCKTVEVIANGADYEEEKLVSLVYINMEC